MRCGANHHTAECKKPRDQPAKCANCEGAHPANYRGCPAFPKPKAANKVVEGQRVQARKLQPEQAKPARAAAQAPQPAAGPSSLIQEGKSYASAMKGKAPVGRDAPKKTAAKPQSQTATEKPTPATASAGGLPQLLGLLGKADSSRLVALLEKLLDALKKSDGDLLSGLLVCLPDIAALI